MKKLIFTILIACFLVGCKKDATKDISAMTTEEKIQELFDGMKFDGLNYTVIGEDINQNIIYHLTVSAAITEEQMNQIIDVINDSKYRYFERASDYLLGNREFEVSDNYIAYLSFFISQKKVDGGVAGTSGTREVIIDKERMVVYLEYYDPINSTEWD